MRWQHAVIWRLKQKPSTQLCFFDICVALVSVVGRVRIIATPSLRKIAPKEPVRELSMRASLARTEIGPHGLTILNRIESMMSCSSRYPGRCRDESSLLPQKHDPQCFFFDKTPVRSSASDHRIPAMICDKSLGTRFFPLPQLLTIPKPLRSAGYCNKSLVRSCSSVTKLWSSASAHRIQCRYVTKSWWSLISSFANPSPSRSRPVPQVLQQKPDPQLFFFDKTPVVICGNPSDPVTICDKIWCSHFSSSAGPHDPPNRPGRPDVATKAWSAVCLL